MASSVRYEVHETDQSSMTRHLGETPIQPVKLPDDGKSILPGPTKDAIEALPKFEYAEKK